MISQLEKDVKPWGNSGGIAVDKRLIGKKVYVITTEDLRIIHTLMGMANGK